VEREKQVDFSGRLKKNVPGPDERGLYQRRAGQEFSRHVPASSLKKSGSGM
jgi:hypothetical protein